jgi:metallo-beta-lactamase class B
MLACLSPRVPLDRLPGPADPSALPEARPVEPFAIFDDLYYIGNDWVSCYLVVTSDGLILIDSLYGEHAERAIRSIEALGFDPREIRYVLVTHGHFDHAGGARLFQARYGARIAMAAPDWRVASERDEPGPPFDPPDEDIVLGTGETIVVGDTRIRVHQTPGHTEGVLSFELVVHDRGQPHRAFVFGGVGLDFVGVPATRSYLESVERIRALAEGEPPIEVNLANHPAMGELFERAERLRERAPGARHPFVDAPAFRGWLDGLERAAERKLYEEIAHRSGP